MKLYNKKQIYQLSNSNNENAINVDVINKETNELEYDFVIPQEKLADFLVGYQKSENII